MKDGEVYNALSSTTSAQRCYLFDATSKDLNNINVMLKMMVKTEHLRFRLSILHLWIHLSILILIVYIILNKYTEIAGKCRNGKRNCS